MEKNRLQLVDYFKGISISAIVVYHLLTIFMQIAGPLAQVSSFAGAGIHLFNICSAFGLALSQLRRPLDAAGFFKRRFLKIYIPYFLAITLYFACTAFMFQSTDPLGDYLSHIFLYKMFLPHRINSYGGHFWYISTIVQFYLLFLPLMAVKKRLGSKKFLALTVLISALWITLTQLLGVGDQRVFYNCAIQYLWEFGLGICLAQRYADRGSITEKPLPRWLVAAVSVVSLGIFGITSTVGGLVKSYNDVFALTAIAGIYYLAYQWKPLAKLFSWVSTFSFAWYLTHFLVMLAIFQELPGSKPFHAALALPASLLFAWLFHRLTKRLSRE